MDQLPTAPDADSSHLDPPGDKSLSAEVIKAIRGLIVRGHFPQGELLSEETIKNDLLKHCTMDVSRMPIRQAIAQLEAEGIMEVIPKKGTKIRRPSDDELKEIWDSRVALEEFLIVQLASRRKRELTQVERALQDMRGIVGNDEYAVPTPAEHEQFIDLDQEFHEAIARAAGYPRLAEELSSLRFKLRFAAPVPPFATKQRMVAIVQEHEDIVRALTGISSHEGIRPDINMVRHAFLVHMRNSGRDSWRIEQRIKPALASDQSSQNYVFDVPDLPKNDRKEDMPVGLLFEMRLCTEMCAAWQLALRPQTNLAMLKSLNQQMTRIEAHLTSQEGPIPIAIETEFINLDVCFHGALCFLSGMLFGEEAVTHSWHKLHYVGEYALDRARIKTILEQHARILDVLQKSKGQLADAEAAAVAVEEHLFGAFIRNNFDPDMQTQTIRFVQGRLQRMEKMAEEQRRRLSRIQKIASREKARLASLEATASECHAPARSRKVKKP